MNADSLSTSADADTDTDTDIQPARTAAEGDAAAGSDAPPIVELRGIDRSFVVGRVETRALSGVSFDIRRGEHLLISGPSGCGKSTLLSILGLLDAPTGGSYRLDGVDATGLGLAKRARLRNRLFGFVFQSFNLIADLTIAENVELPLRYRRGGGRAVPAARREKALHLLEEVGIAHRAGHYPAQLSGGQQQRAAVARALIGDPALVFADEPTGNLDADSARTVMELLRGCNARGATLCVVSHNPAYAERADRTLRLAEGRLESDA